ncbi:C40 family peptidase [Paenibacillus gansuensis]|uniref:C40 family peptidase n=1 Tax=Paenibacillus gansuensis TaxID=306542 RepID=A0ABW5PGC1_9BACL
MNNKRTQLPALLLGVALTLSTGAAGLLTFVPAAHASAATASVTADNIIATGKQFLGTPYKFGAESMSTSSFDCSSFIQYVFMQNGIDLPRSSREQSKAGVHVSKNALQPGDLVFSDTDQDGELNHVSIYIGNDQLLHTYRVGIGVTVSQFSGSTWDNTYVTARRVLPEQQVSERQTSKPAEAVQSSGQGEDSSAQNASPVESGSAPATPGPAAPAPAKPEPVAPAPAKPEPVETAPAAPADDANGAGLNGFPWYNLFSS